MTKEIIATKNAPEAIGPYAQAIKTNGTIYTSGQLPLNPKTMKIEEETIEGQARQALDNLKAVLEAAGSSLEHVVKTTCFLADLGHFTAFNEIYAEYFGTATPARSTFQVAALPLGAKIEIEAVAIICEQP